MFNYLKEFYIDMINMNSNIFTLAMVIAIEKEIQEYIESIELDIDMDIKKTIYEVIQALASNPKTNDKVTTSQEMHIKVVNIVKKYITKQNQLIENKHIDDYKTKFKELQKTRKSLDIKVEHKLDKHIILDSNKAETLNSNELHFTFKTPIQVKNINLTYMTIHSNEELSEPYLYIQSSQLRTNNYTDVNNVLDCLAILILNKEIKHENGTFTYHYKNINKHVNNDISLLVTQLNFKFYISMTDRYVNISDIYSITTHEIDGDDHQIYFENANDFNEGEKLTIIDDNKQTYKVIVVNKNSEMLTVQINNNVKVNTNDIVFKNIEKANKRIILYIDHM
tara:strand:- start:4825 stop:5835 length:1011 start_codon:yes stop_codon:yes gene_type:complete